MGFILRVPEELQDWIEKGPIPQEIVDRNINNVHVNVKQLTVYCNYNIRQFMNDIYLDMFRQYLINKGIDEVIRIFILEEFSSIVFYNVIRLYECDDSIVKMTFYVSSGGQDIFTIDDMNIKSYTNSRLLYIYGIDYSNIVSEEPNVNLLNTTLLMHLDNENIDPTFTASLKQEHLYTLMLLSGMYPINFDTCYISRFIKDKELIEDQFIFEFVSTCLEHIYISSIPININLYNMIVCAAKAYKHKNPEKTTVDDKFANKIKYRFINNAYIPKTSTIDYANYINICMNYLQIGFFGIGGIILLDNEDIFGDDRLNIVTRVNNLIYWCDGDVNVVSNVIDTIFNDMEIFKPLNNGKNIVQEYIDLFNCKYRNDSDSCIVLYIHRVMQSKMNNMSYEDKYNAIQDKLSKIKDPALQSTLKNKYDPNNIIPIFDTTVNL